MSKAYMERINALRKNYLSHRVEMDIKDAYYVTQGFKATEGQPWAIQKATAMKMVYENKPIFIQDNELLVGGVAFKPRAGILNPDSACSVIERELDTIRTRKYDPFYLSEENKKLFMEEVAPYWRGKCVLDRWNAMMPDDVRTMRDVTRGGLGTVINEIAESSACKIELDEDAIPVSPQVKGFSDILGLDPLYMGNEGKMIAVVPEAQAEVALAAMRSAEHGKDAVMIGRVLEGEGAFIKTHLGATRRFDVLYGEGLPRIC